jgi:ribonuclease D
VNYDFVKTPESFRAICSRLEAAKSIAFDTEFVSEFTYFPDLCLVQVASEDVLAVIDPKEVDVAPLWELMVHGDHELIVHAGREEYRFIRRATDAMPTEWFDIQLAAGMVGADYPASYGKLLQRFLGEKLGKGETRTDWRKRPLSKAQIEYAVQDVVHLTPLRNLLFAELERLQRVDWYHGEIEAWRQKTEDTESRNRWRRVNGTSGLSRKSLTVVKELWIWRDKEAQQRDCLPRRVLRDDLIVELARRARPGVSQIQAIRGFERRDLQRHLPAISSCIEKAIAQPLDRDERNKRPELPPQIGILAQFLNTALTSMCNRESIAPGIVGTIQDVRDLIAESLGLDTESEAERPALLEGWRYELVGRRLQDLLSGKSAIRLTDPLSDRPLTFE